MAATPGARHAVVVDPYSSGNMLAPALRRAGFVPVAVTSGPEPPIIYTASWRPQDFAEVVVAGPDLAATLARLRPLEPACVLTGAESGVELGDAIIEALTPRFANAPELVRARRDKALMGAAAAAAGVRCPRQVATGDPEVVAAWIAREGLADRAIVLKPPHSAGTDGVVRVGPGEDWRAAFAGLVGRRNRLGAVNDRVVVQEFLAGDEYVVDTMSADGRHIVTDLCVYRKVVTPTAAIVYDSMEFLPEDPTGGVLVEFTGQVLDALGIRHGPAHTELMLTADGPHLIETGARMHGGGQPEIADFATGHSQLDRMVAHYTGVGEVAGDYHLERAVLVVFLSSPRGGRLVNADVFDAATRLPTHFKSYVKVRNGDVVAETRDLHTSIGMIVLGGKDRNQVLADYAAIRELEARLRVDDLDDGDAGGGGAGRRADRAAAGG